MVSSLLILSQRCQTNFQLVLSTTVCIIETHAACHCTTATTALHRVEVTDGVWGSQYRTLGQTTCDHTVEQILNSISSLKTLQSSTSSTTCSFRGLYQESLKNSFLVHSFSQEQENFGLQYNLYTNIPIVQINFNAHAKLNDNIIDFTLLCPLINSGLYS